MSWMRHVYRDLRPYICTFEFCVRSEYLFASRQEWFEHERAFHRREWNCNACKESSTSKEMFRQHLQTRHPDEVQTEVFVQRAEEAIEAVQECPLCKKTYFPRRLQSHLGHHMQQIALFILPGASSDDNEKESVGEFSESDADDFEKEHGPDSPPAIDTSEEGFHAAIRDGNLAVVRTGLSTMKNSPDADGYLPIHRAAQAGHANIVEVLLQAGVVVNAEVGTEERTPLSWASGNGHADVVDQLLEKGADVNAKPTGIHGRTALQAASDGGHLAVVDRLLEKGADVNAEPAGIHGRTALQAASDGGHLAVVDRLLEKGADVNAEPAHYDGRTALQAASDGGHLAVVDRLLEKGADVNAEPAHYDGRTALQAASDGGYLAVMERLRRAGAIHQVSDR